MSNNLTEPYDLLFIGMGAANCLLLIKMFENDLLRDKKIAIIEPSKSVISDRNFCFWASDKELQELKLGDLVSSKWQNIKVADQKYQSISPLYYNHIKGRDLYNKVQEILKEQETKHYQEIFNGIPLLKPDSFIITLKDTKIEAKKVFDSRPPSYDPADKNQSHLLQSFYGWELSAKDYTFNTSAIVMMDFDIPQDNFCQFMYILPFTKNRALIEVTRFGKEKITEDEAKKILREYTAKLGFSYQIEEEERGVIPMSTLKISEINYGENWIVTGSSANMIKPTTGYAFHNMAVDANKQVKAILNKHAVIREKPKKRFLFYDKLLLKILEESPQHGKQIFKDLFNHIPINNVLTFLSEKSTFGKELFIFSKLPILIFLRAAFKNIFYSFTKIAPTYLAFITTIFALILYIFNLNEVLWLFLGLGFLSIGLSHGSLDYLTDKSIQNRKQLLQFIVTYLIKGAILGIIWIGVPDVALLVFIAFSAWHFGQADFKQWNLKQGFISFIWGLIVLTTILLFHLDETIGVLEQIQGLQIHYLLKNIAVNHLFIGKTFIVFFSILVAAYYRSKLMLVTLSYLLICSVMPLIVSFGIYFVAQHSVHGWLHLKKDLKTSSYDLWLKSLPSSIGGAFVFLTFMLLNSKEYFGVFFILLSCISMPHVLSMHNFYSGFNRTIK